MSTLLTFQIRGRENVLASTGFPMLLGKEEAPGMMLLQRHPGKMVHTCCRHPHMPEQPRPSYLMALSRNCAHARLQSRDQWQLQHPLSQSPYSGWPQCHQDPCKGSTCVSDTHVSDLSIKWAYYAAQHKALTAILASCNLLHNLQATT